MNTPNIGWLYFKDYLRISGDPARLFLDRKKWEQEEKAKNNDAKNKNFDRFFNGYIDDDGYYHPGKNQIILEQEFNKSLSGRLSVILPNENLRFKTIYPGLTLGTGYTHETGELGEFKLGFFFDHATGYPCIPGSTVKGCLRGMFPQKERDGVADKNEKYHYLASVIRKLPNLKEGFILENDLGEEFDQQLTNKRTQFIDFLERELFDGEKPERDENGTPQKKDEKIIYKPLCVYERDIFFDGYIVSTNHPAISRSAYQNQKPFIGDDYITPHQNRKKPELSPFTNPIPLMFLKILPEVTIQFQFNLKPGLLTKEQKEELFRQLLLDFGIGAKTNIGYGQFDAGIVATTSKQPLEIENILIPENIIPANAIPFLRKNCSFQGEVLDQIGLYNIYKFKVGHTECRLKKQSNKNPELKKGDKVTILFKLDYQNGIPNFQVK
jgi:CRISPR-associated protein Cmr6